VGARDDELALLAGPVRQGDLARVPVLSAWACASVIATWDVRPHIEQLRVV